MMSKNLEEIFRLSFRWGTVRWGVVQSEVIILRLANFCLPTRGNLNMTIVRFAVVIGRKAEVPICPSLCQGWSLWQQYRNSLKVSLVNKWELNIGDQKIIIILILN